MSKTKITCLQFIFFIFVFVQVGQAQPFTWTTPVNVSNVSWYNCSTPCMCQDNNGNIYIVWRYNPSGGSDLDLYFAWFDGQIWHPAEKLYNDHRVIYNNHIIADSSGVLHLCFEQYFGDFGRLFYMKRQNGIWGSAIQLSVDTLGPAYANSGIVMDSQNHLHVFWSNTDIFGRSYDGNSWTAIQRITNLQTGYETLFPKAAVDKNDNIHLVFILSGPSYEDFQLYYERFNGAFWTDAENISRNDSLWATNPDIIVDMQNTPHVVWQQQIRMLGQNYEIFYSEYSNNTWTLPINISNLNDFSMRPLIRNFKDNSQIVFFNFDHQLYYAYSTSNRWQVNHWELNSVVAPISDLVVSNSGELLLSYVDLGTPHIGDIFFAAGSEISKIKADRLFPSANFAVMAPYPNPFNLEISARFYVNYTMPIIAKIYDLLGKEVIILICSSKFPPGDYVISWNGTNQNGKEVSSGIYYLVFKAKGQIISRKILLIR